MGFAVQPRKAVVFHFVAEGRAFVRQPDAETMELQPGELVLFPHGSEHEVAHSPRGKAIHLEAFLARRDGVIDPGPKAVTLICGASGPAGATTGSVAPRRHETRIFTAERHTAHAP